jgi:hypothetical protein
MMSDSSWGGNLKYLVIESMATASVNVLMLIQDQSLLPLSA